MLCRLCGVLSIKIRRKLCSGASRVSEGGNVEINVVMDENFNIQKLLLLRKITRAVSDLLRAQMREHLTTLAPLVRPKTVLGDYIQSSSKDATRGGEKAFRGLQSAYESLAPAKPYNLTKELKLPIEIVSSALEMTPMEYTHTARSERESKFVSITSPLRWVLNYSGFSLNRLKELMADRNRRSDDVREFLLHYLVMQTVFHTQTGVASILGALHFPITTGRLPEFGELPITYISSSISTMRPPDEVIIESTEISGSNAFEEVINLEDIIKLRDPLRERLIETVRGFGDDLLPQS